MFHDVPIEDLFFSTTDAKGVIDEANEVFARNSRYERSELLGSPHNIIRHPDMPGAVFKTTWDLLGAGHPVCAYVKNLARDGSTYWAFATIVPIAGRFLSVRATPCDRAARDLFESLYETVRRAELAARDAGASSREAAEVGCEVLSQALAENGFGSYTDLQLDLVPVEVAAREEACPPLPDLPDGSKTARKILGQVSEARSSLGAFATDIAGSLTLTDTLARDLRRLRAALTGLDSAVTSAAATPSPPPSSPPSSAPTVGFPEPAAYAGAHADVAALVPVIRARLATVGNAVGRARDELTAVVQARKQLALSSAIARMQAEAIGRYVVAVETGAEDPRVSERALSSLTTALLAILDADLHVDRAATTAYVDRVARLATEVAAARETTLAWRSLLEDISPHEALLALDVALGAVADQMRRVADAVGAVAATNAALDRDALAAALGRIVELAAKV
jgi:aerotaxis receptor